MTSTRRPRAPSTLVHRTGTALRRRWGPPLLALVAYAAAVPWVFRPWFTARDLLPHAPGPVGGMVDADLYLNIWILAWVAHAILTDPTALLDGNIFHPAPNTIAGSENMLAHVPITATVLAATGSALAVLKAYVLESFATTGLGMFLYVRHHTRNAWVALAAGAAFTFTPFRVDTIPQPQYLGMAFFPLALLAIDLHLETGRRRWLGAFSAALVLQALCCVYIGFFAFILCPVYVLARTLPRGRGPNGWIAPTARLAAAMVVAAIALVPAALPYLRGRSEGMIPEHGLQYIQFASWPPWLFFSSEFVWRAGVVAVGLVAIDLVRRAWRRLGGARESGPGPWTTPVAALWMLAAAATVLAAGPYLPLPGGHRVPLPYVALYELVPGFSSIRVPIRFVIIVSAAIAGLSGFALAQLLARRSETTTALVAIALAGIAIYGSAPGPKPVMPAHLEGAHAAVYRWLADRPDDGAVLEIPGQSTEQDVVGNLRNGRYMVASSIHWRPLLNGYTAYPPTSAGFYSSAIRELPAPEALALLVETSDLRWLVIHRDELTPREAARWPDEPTDGLVLRARFGTDEIYEVTRARERGWRREIPARMAGDVDDTLEGTPLRPLPDRCRRGAILEADTPERIPPFPLALRVPVRIRNESDCPWPAVGLRDTDLVGLDYRWVPGPDGAGIAQDRVPLFRLLADVPPGGEATGAIMLSPPKGPPGRWTLEIRLLQEGSDEPLASTRRTVDVRPAKNRG